MCAQVCGHVAGQDELHGGDRAAALALQVPASGAGAPGQLLHFTFCTALPPPYRCMQSSALWLRVQMGGMEGVFAAEQSRITVSPRDGLWMHAIPRG